MGQGGHAGQATGATRAACSTQPAENPLTSSRMPSTAAARKAACILLALERVAGEAAAIPALSEKRSKNYNDDDDYYYYSNPS